MNNLLQVCLVVAGIAYLPERGWPQAVVFLCFGGVLATQQWMEKHGQLAQQLKAATEELASKSEQLKSLDGKVHQLNERMLRYETRTR